MALETLKTGSVDLCRVVNAIAAAVDALGVAGNVVAADLGANAVTGPALSSTAERFIPFTGKNGAGACTATGLKVGDTVVGIINVTDSSNATSLFEATITVADQIQQSSATDLSAKKFALLVVAKS